MIPHSRPWLVRADFDAVAAALEGGQVAAGEGAARLEAALTELADGAETLTCATGTEALVLALHALGVGPGDDAILPTYACPDVAASVQRVGAQPVFADNASPWRVGPETVAPLLGPRVRVVIAISTFGAPVDVAGLAALGVPIIEDACHVLPHVSPLGPLAARVSSFHATKTLCAGEGGAVTFASPEVGRAARRLRDVERLVAPLSDLAAALATSQLDRRAAIRARRAALALRYLAAFPSAHMASARGAAEGTWLRCPLRLSGADGARFDALARACADGGVAVRRGVDVLLHRAAGGDDALFPHAVSDFQATVSPPFHPSLTEAEVQTVIEVVGAGLRALSEQGR